MNLQPSNLNDGTVHLTPLTERDFNELFSVASDPLIWEQHPNSNRYQKDEFSKFFLGALNSKGAFKISDSLTHEVLGSSRYYDLDIENKSIFIGFTFLRKDKWGGNYNARVKALMINYAFQFVDNIFFQIGKTNIRSLKATEKIGARVVGEQILEGIEHLILKIENKIQNKI